VLVELPHLTVPILFFHPLHLQVVVLAVLVVMGHLEGLAAVVEVLLALLVEVPEYLDRDMLVAHQLLTIILVAVAVLVP
jgi:hypothetical protein